ncbi:MAG: glucose-6-phosphate dehydrogenase assembly protein OpcA [Actinomycetota bacterium]
MIVDLPNTTTGGISRMLVTLRNEVGAVSLGRVLTMIIVADDTEAANEAIESAIDASRQHPCRIIALRSGKKSGASRLDAQIRIGGDAGAGEVIVLRTHGELVAHGNSALVPLLLPDSPVVAWWPKSAPPDVSASAIGQMAQRRITDAAEASNPWAEMQRRAESYQPGDTDLAWTRITLWRGLLAAALDQPPYEPVIAATVTGARDSPSVDLMAGWLAEALRCPVTRVRTSAGTGMTSVRLERRSGNIDIVRPHGSEATMAQPGQPVRQVILGRRELVECLADELRRLDPDEIYQETLTKGLARLAGASTGRATKNATKKATAKKTAKKTAPSRSRKGNGPS